MAKWYRVPLTMRATEKEYRANIEGVNIVFGAVLGFVLAGTEAMPTEQFVYALFLSAAVVISILYLGSSDYRLFYTGTTIAGIALLPGIMDTLEIPEIPKLQPTLAVWTGMVILIELLPREKEPGPN